MTALAITAAVLLAIHSLAVIVHTSNNPWFPAGPHNEAFHVGLIADATIGVLAAISLGMGHPYGLGGLTLALLVGLRVNFLVYRIIPPSKRALGRYHYDGLARAGLVTNVVGSVLPLYVTTPTWMSYGFMALGGFIAIGAYVMAAMWWRHQQQDPRKNTEPQ